ncbi:DNA ligase 4 [Golovinomyces cichoracearum]|uniref:DNA ligase n=1 Tax=Golovinomyces cichoracearum TaxID=62708 RepID=A0A420J4D0_9PEZI|nr:DNA ligase 4 [Golovinomyces cichoracearum]
MNSNLRKFDLSAQLDDEIQYSEGSLTLDELDSKFPDRPRNHHQTLPFHELSTLLFSPLTQTKRKHGDPPAKKKHCGKIGSFYQKRTAIIKHFISRWRAMVGDDFFPALRLILPERDRDRAMYGIKEKSIAKLIIKILRIDRRSGDASKLLNWKLPTQKSDHRFIGGDFASRCYEVLSKRSQKTCFGDMRISEVNQLLNQLSVTSKEAEQLPIFDKFYCRMNAEEMMWLIRIILRDTRVGTSERTILNLWHPDGEALFNVSSNLKKVCWELTDPVIRFKKEMPRITLMEPFLPQLAQFNMNDFEKIISRLGCDDDDKLFWIEEKLDGERMQLHMKEDETIPGGFRFAFWSRNGKEYTHLYGQGFQDDNSSLTKFIREAFSANIKNIILDGEMITWDPQTAKVVAFGTLKTAALSEQQNQHHNDLGNRPLFRVFDCLYINGRQITQYILRERRQVLERALRDVPERIEIHKHISATSTDQIEEQLRKVIAESSEGLVLKNPRSAYRFNSRNDDWIKVKPEYMTGFGESLDCVVIGGYFGRDNRTKGLKSFLCGLRVDKNHIDKGANPMKCYSFFRVGGGLNSSDYSRIWHQTDGKWIDWDSKNPPDDFIVLGGGKRQLERPDKWIKPEDSVVLEVKATSIFASKTYGSGYSLRFPRFKRLRDDKSWKEALSIYELLDLKKMSQEESTERKFDIETKRSKVVKREKKEIVIAGNENRTEIDDNNICLKTKIFEGLTFCVMSEMLQPMRKTKVEIERIIKMNGGNVIQNPTIQENIICISEKRVVKVASLIKGGRTDIIKPNWIFDSLEQSRISCLSHPQLLLPLEPRYILHATEKTRKLFKETVDIYRDSYNRNVTIEELRDIMADMTLPSSDDFSLDKFLSSIIESHEREMITRVPAWIFLGFKARFVTFLTENDLKDSYLHLARTQFLFCRGKIASHDNDDVITHFIIADARFASVLESTRKKQIVMHQRQNQSHVVSLKWLSDSWAEQKLLCVKDYEIDLTRL